MLVAVATIGGIVLQQPGESVAFQSARGEAVELFGRGLYRYDSVFSGANFRSQDIVALALGLPIFVVALVLYMRGSLRGVLVLAGMFGFFLYVYASMALMSAFNPFFLVYVGAMSAGLFGLILSLRTLDQPEVLARMTDDMPYRSTAVFMFAGGAVTLFVWLLPLLDAQLRDVPPEHLDHYTTMVTDAIDLSVITPATFICGALLLRRRPLGFLYAMPLLATIVMLLPLITGGTISQIQAGIEFTPAEIVGPIAGFAVLGVAGISVLVAILRRIKPDSR
jgi:hypothetical protein